MGEQNEQPTNLKMCLFQASIRAQNASKNVKLTICGKQTPQDKHSIFTVLRMNISDKDLNSMFTQ